MGNNSSVKRWFRFCAIALLTGTSATVLVADNEVPFVPGLWEIKSTTTSALPGVDGDDVDTECITTDLFSLDEMKNQIESTLPDGMCEIDRTAKGDTLEVSMVCSGGGGTTTGDGFYTVGDAGKSMVAEMVMKMEFAGTPVEIKTVATGKWVGEC